MSEITQKLVDGAGLQIAMGIMGNYSDNMDRGIVGGYNQSFPLTAATKGNIYYHKPTNRYYICINNYSGSSLTNPNSNFEELSVYTNRQRLDNLSKVTVMNARANGSTNIVKYPSGFNTSNCFFIVNIEGTDNKNSYNVKYYQDRFIVTGTSDIFVTCNIIFIQTR